MKLALVTCDDFPDLSPDDHALVRTFASRGVDAVPAIWSDASIAWGDFDAALLRSTWDYFHRLPEFLAWLPRVSAATRLFNPPSYIGWNADKHYLRELAARGVPTVATAWRKVGEPLGLESLVRETGWQRLLVKPAVSGGAFATLRVDDDPAARAAAEAKLAPYRDARAFLVQPYLPSVAGGEVSLLYFGGRFSHAVNKVPLPGDFRVQDNHGGVASVHVPTDAERAVAERTLAATADCARERAGRTGRGGGDPDDRALDLLYARVDLLPGDDGTPRLLEIELIEPSLFFAEAQGAEERLVDALLARVGHSAG